MSEARYFIFLVYLFFLWMGGIGLGSINRTDFSAFGGIMVTNALYTFFGVDDICGLSLADSLYGTF